MKVAFTLFCAMVFSFAHAQLLTWSPQFITDASVNTVIVANDSLGNQGLLNHATNDVFVHIGIITNKSTSSSDWQHVQSTYPGNGGTNTDSRFQAVSVGTNKWQYTVLGNLRTFFGVTDATEKIYKIAILFRSGNGLQKLANTDGSDMYIPVYDASLQARINQPFRKPTYTPVLEPLSYVAGNTVPVTAVASTASTLSILYNGVTIGSKTDSIITANGTAAIGNNRIIVNATSGSVTKSDTVNFYINSSVVVKDLPAGVRDGINYGSDGTSVTLVLYAPYKTRAGVIGEFNNWTRTQATEMYRTTDGSRYWVTLTGLIQGQEYAYQYVIDDSLKVADVFSEKVLDPANDAYIDAETYPNLKAYPAGQSGIVSVLQTAKPAYTWQVNNFTRPDKRNLVIYELLVRDFVAKHNWNTVRDTLSYLKRLGVNAIEVMPFNEFEGNISWGYNPSFFFAPDKYYGTDAALKQFIDECHRQGIAVIMDIVMNHTYGQSPTVQMYYDPVNQRPAANNPWQNPVAPHSSLNFGYDFNHESTATQELVQRVVEYWLMNYKLDGFRWDFTKGFTQKQTSSDAALSAYDISRITTLQRIYDTIQTISPGAYDILEHFCDNSEETQLSNYGMMLWGNANYNYLQASMGYVNPGDQSDFGYGLYTARNWTNPFLVTYMESHDEERMMFKNEAYGNSNGSYNVKNIPTGLSRSGMSAALFMMQPGPKLIWQFGELGYDYSINTCENGTTISNDCRTSPKPIRWDYQTNINRDSLYNVYARLAALRNYAPYLPAFTVPKNNIQYSFSNPMKWEVITSTPLNIAVIGNFNVIADSVVVTFPHAGVWYDYLNNTTITVTGTSYTARYQPGEYHVFIDQNASTVLPLQILSFSGVRSTNAILLNWTAANEANLSNYTVERSFNGRDFSSVGNVTALNTAQRSYVFADKDAAAINASGNLYYRLKTTEKNGTVTYSTIIKIEPLSADSKISLYPNPVRGAVTYVKMSGNITGSLRVSITDASGRICSVQTLQANGSNSLPLNVSSLANGLYNVKITNSNQPLLTQKIIIQK